MLDLGIVPDSLDATRAALRDAAAQADLIVTSGGVSVGEEDHLRPAVQAEGRLTLWALALKPGKPFAFGKVGGSWYVGLPGNPVSSLVTFLLLVRPAVLKLQGVTALQTAQHDPASRLRLAAQRHAPRVHPRACRRRRSPGALRQPKLRRAQLRRLGRWPADLAPNTPLHGRHAGALHPLSELLA